MSITFVVDEEGIRQRGVPQSVLDQCATLEAYYMADEMCSAVTA